MIRYEYPRGKQEVNGFFQSEEIPVKDFIQEVFKLWHKRPKIYRIVPGHVVTFSEPMQLSMEESVLIPLFKTDEHYSNVLLRSPQEIKKARYRRKFYYCKKESLLSTTLMLVQK